MSAPASVEALGERLIPIVSKLQEILLGAQLSKDCDIDLPQVAVVGSQSSGKSSVLESLVGRDFLPRGADICTRRPLILHLRRSAADTNGAEWAEFPAHLPGRRFTDFDDVRREIVAETDRLLGVDNKNISSVPIHLTIHSPHVLTMSLVDLPGMTRVPVKGQRDDIADQLQALITDCIRCPSCIILAVSAANTDLANSDAIMLARSVDPQGERTIGVLTKLDIMDRGTDAVAMLKNQVLPLRLGYIGVVNRAQADVSAGTLISDARRAEEQFFDSSPSYRSVRQQCGIAALSARIKTILVDHIRQRLPQLKAEIEGKAVAKQAEVAALGGSQPDLSPAARGEFLLRLLNVYQRSFTGLLNGRDSHIAAMNGLHGGARIRHVFCEIFCPTINNLDACRGLTDEQIWNTISNCTGVRSRELVSTAAFEVLVRRAIGLLRKPMHHCVQLVSQELLRIAGLCMPQDVTRFPTLQRRLEQLVREFITASMAPAEQMLTDLYECEVACLNCDHPDFLGARGAIREVMDERHAAKMAAERGADRHGRAHSRSSPAPAGRHHVYSTTALHEEQSASESNLAEAEAEVEDHGFWFSSLFGGRKAERDPPAPSSSVASSAFLQSSGPFGNASPRTSGAPGVGLAAVLGRPDRRSDEYMAADGPSLPSAPSQLLSRITTDTQINEVLVMRKMVDSYFGIVRRTMSDLVPKVITRFMVVQAESRLHAHLIQQLYRSELFEELMREHPEVVARRERCLRELSILQAASAQLQTLPAELAAHSLPPTCSQPSGLPEADAAAANGGDSLFEQQQHYQGDGDRQGLVRADTATRAAQLAMAPPDDLERMSYEFGSAALGTFVTAGENAL